VVRQGGVTGIQRTVSRLGMAAVCLAGVPAAFAYDATGDRQFVSTLVLPQLMPGDQAYFNYSTLPLSSSGPGRASRSSSWTATQLKTITDNLGIELEETYSRVDQVGSGTLSGWQNLDGELKYTAINDPLHEFVTTLGLDRETGGTGAGRVGASPSGATTPRVYFGKGFGDWDIGYLRPLAITGLAGVQIADTAPRPNLITTGFVIEYSIPYLQSKVQSFDLPEFMRRMTPLTEIALTSSAGRSFGAHPTQLIAPGVSYAGDGWELAVEAQVPGNRATGSGVGVTAQLTVALDFLLPTTLGKPLFSSQ
jgi:hypothetical protein